MDRKELETDIYLESAANREGLYPFIFAVFASIGVDVYAGNFGSEDILPAAIIFAFIVALSLIEAFSVPKNTRQRLLLNGGYHVLWIVALALLVPIGSLYMVFGAQLVFQAHYAFGKVGSIGSIAVQVLAFAVLTLVLNDNPTKMDFADVVRSGALIMSVTLSSTAVLDVARKEIKRVRQVSSSLYLTTHRIQSLINNMAETVISTDSKGMIIDYNSSTLSLINTNVDLHKKLLSEVFDLHNKDDETVDIIAQARKESGPLYRNDIYHRYGTGDSARLSISVSPLILSSGNKQIKGFSFVIRDITKQMSLEEKRDEFVSVISHELRTPVAISEGNIEIAEIMYKENKDDPKLQEALGVAHEQMKYLSNLVNDLVVLSMAEQDKVEVKVEHFSPVKLGEEIIESFRESAHEKELNLFGNFAPEIHTIETSRIFSEEIIKNLITNSIKYTKEGEIELIINQDETKTTFSVRDTGRGISKSDQKHIFEKFFRAEEFHTRETGGTGLGLHIVLQLAQRIGGEITFESELGKGSTFTYTISNHPKKNDHDSPA